MSSSAEFGKIYEAISAKKLKAYAECDVESCAELYAEHAVMVTKRNNTRSFGIEEIKKRLKTLFDACGPYTDFKFPRHEIYWLGSDRFYVNNSYIVTSRKGIIEGSYEMLFEKINGEWKCVYEN